ncbi:MAG TPA: outer membrane protein assembly factor BamE [Burkholderiales bacterium]|nr:outer membrane protein assembly factor BamE [Burkholderiales bacterium]
MRFAIILLVLFLAACSAETLVTPYKIDVQQGNVVTDEMLSKIKPGMTKAQVRYALGTPLIVDPFHADRWDYVYRMSKDGKLLDQSRLTVVFEGDQLKTIEGAAIPPSDNVPGSKFWAPKAVPALASVPEQSNPDKRPTLDLKQVESDLGATPQTAPVATEAAKSPADQGQAEQASQTQVIADGQSAQQPDQTQADETNEAQAQKPKRSFGERFMRLLGFGKKEETHGSQAQEKSEAKSEQQSDQSQAEQTNQALMEQPKRSFGERFLSLFGFGKKEEKTQQAKLEEKPETQSEAQPESQPDAEPPTNTVVNADREPPPKRSVGERFMRLIGFRGHENDEDPAPPVHTEVDNSVPTLSSLSFKRVWRQILGIESESDREQAAAAGDIEPGEKVKTAPKGTTWQRFKRLIGIDSEETETTYTVDEPQNTQTDKKAKPDAADSGGAKP